MLVIQYMKKLLVCIIEYLAKIYSSMTILVNFNEIKIEITEKEINEQLYKD